ncbi:MAG TPA: glycosyltransferase [Methylomusa anaerophila]|uniref:Processive diacylglycerol beta-glucosyltransferase n=1 Tax=Methylomusa anaerophila TaxID=1930071 RepID=A0A348AQ52_9FIRM|nr:glycosyltransferase [Methylomusa anaerophila]BBB93200.1 processive diacylglycerol beta-glucosyltransferase [Methylomusa anaerophila]HML86968.1 glycosyltransferase [Methylomusa anaerophila]
MAPNKVLFISAPIGAGHTRAAQAVSDVIIDHYPDVETCICNVFDFFSPQFGELLLKGYLKILEYYPQAYGRMYDWGNASGMALYSRDLLSRYLAGRMFKFIADYQPTVIVCTHATPAGLVAWLVRQGKINIPAAAVITDYVVHRLWIYREIARYYVADILLRDSMIQQGVEPSSIGITGIPVLPVFTQKLNKQQTRKKLGLKEDLKTILIMGGGAGVLPMEQILSLCNNLDVSLQLVLVTGKNTTLYDKLNKLKNTLRRPAHIYGYVDNVYELMAAADIFVSKPGGMSAAEAMATGLPLIIFRPIPGQEEANTRFLTKNGVAVCADSLADLKLILHRLLINNPEQLGIISRQALNMAKPNAAYSIVDDIAKNYFHVKSSKNYTN